MLRIREFEERVKRTFEEHPGAIRGHTHLADGAEASIVGSLAALRDGDQLLTTYRCHGYPIALGTDPKAMMAEIYGRRTGSATATAARCTSTDLGRGFLGTSGIVGQGIPHAAGAAYAAQIRGQGPGRAQLLRRRRVEAGRVPRVAQHRLALEAADRLHHGEQQLQRAHARRAGGRECRRRRAAGGEGEGLLDARRDRGRRRPAGGVRGGLEGGRARPLGRRADARRVARLPPQRPRQHHRAARRAAPLSRARGDRPLRQPGGVRGGDAGRPGPALPRAARQDGTLAAEDADRIAEEVRAEMQAAVDFGLESPFPPAEAATDYVYA